MEDNDDQKQNLFSWSDEMSVGNSVIDADHKAFLDLANLLTLWSSKADETIIESAITILEEYVRGHFFREEKAMKAMGYKDYVGHHLRHEHFKARIAAIVKLYREGTRSAAHGLSELVGTWLIKHIKNDDQDCKDCFRTSVVDDRPLAFLALEADQG